MNTLKFLEQLPEKSEAELIADFERPELDKVYEDLSNWLDYINDLIAEQNRQATIEQGYEED